MLSLPPELVAQLFPGARGIVALKNTCKWLRGCIRDVLYTGDAYIREVKTWSYTICYRAGAEFPALFGVDAPDVLRWYMYSCNDPPLLYAFEYDVRLNCTTTHDHVYARMLYGTGVVHKLRRTTPHRNYENCGSAPILWSIGTYDITCADGVKMEIQDRGLREYYVRDGVTLNYGDMLIIGRGYGNALKRVRTSDPNKIIEWLPELGGAYVTADKL